MRPGLSTWSRLLRNSLPIVLLAGSLCGCATTSTTAATASEQAGAHPAIAAAEQLARQDAELAGKAREDNAAEIARLLASLDDATLAREAAALPAGDPLYNFAGRALLNRGLPLPRPFDRQSGFGAANRPAADRDGYRPPAKLAVLLPLSGDLSRAAVPVRDGLLAAYYSETRRRPQIDFYDTAGTPAGALAAYQRAVSEGADLVVGPLGRAEVGALFRATLSVPVLALNRAGAHPPTGNASFSLAPEDDGVAAAEYLVGRGAHRVLVLSDIDETARRTVAALRTHLQDRGGTIASVLTVADKPGDMSGALQAAAQAPGGIDALFFALKPAQARAIAPQLAAAGLGDKPRVGTSQLAGSGDAKHALDGIAFPSETWSLQGVQGLPSPASTAKVLPSARGPAGRLFAFGVDTWRLAAYIDFLATHADAKLQGATGTLHLDGFGNVVRTPAWSTYSGASVLPLGNGVR